MKAIFFGDLCITKSNADIFVAGKGGDIFSKKFIDVVESCDFFSFNLECPLIKKNSKPINKCGPSLGANADCINGINYLKPSLICLANNHLYDYGFEGFETTLEVLKKNNINFIGNTNNGLKNNVFIKHGIGIINFCENEFSFNYLDKAGACCLNSTVFPQIVELKKRVNKVVVIFHGGTENFPYPSPNLVTTCHSFVDLGADLVLCQHSHCIGCYEKYNESTIVYGQGNFLFDEYSKEDAWVYGIGVIFDSDSNNVSFVVTNFKNGMVDVSSKNDSVILNNFYDRSKELQNGNYLKKYKTFCNDRYNKFLCKLGGYSKIRTGVEVLLFKGFFINKRYNKKRLLTLFDILNCESHQELIKTAMIEKAFKKTNNK